MAGLIPFLMNRADERARQKGLIGLLGAPGQVETLPQQGPMQPGQERPDITAQTQGTGLLGGEFGLPQFLAQSAALPGMAESGTQGLVNLLLNQQKTAQAQTVKADEKRFSNAKDLRNEFIKQSKDFIQVNDAFGRIKATKSTPAGDLALVFNYMKMLDPQSVVRESEFRTAENAKAWLGRMDGEGQGGNVPPAIRTFINKAEKGTILLPEQRADFIATAESLYGSQQANHEQVRQQYTGLAQRYGVDPQNVIVDYARPKSIQDMSDAELQAIADGK